MAEKIILPAWVEAVSEPIEFPDIAELLTYPFFTKVSPEGLRKEGTEFQKKLLDLAPLKNNTKYISIYSYVQFLNPTLGTNMRKLKGKHENEWHVDRDPDFDFHSTWHIAMNDCTARTEFSVNPTEMDKEDFYNPNYIQMIEALNSDKYKIEGKRCEPFRMNTFNSFHLHRSTTAEKPEFRFFFRIMEQDVLPPYPDEIAMNRPSIIYGSKGEPLESITRTKQGLKLNYNWL